MCHIILVLKLSIFLVGPMTYMRQRTATFGLKEWLEAGLTRYALATCYYHEMKGHGYFEEGVQVGHIVVAADNCSGQNKNKTPIVRFCNWIHECGVAKKATLLFLIKGHTKNICDRLFNLVEHEYHGTNIYSEDVLDASLGKHLQITLRRLTEDDFFDFESFLYDFLCQAS